MKDLSLYVLDIAQNSIRAGASRLEIELFENEATNELGLVITDNGKGMDPLTLEKVKDPFFTTRSTRKVGLGLSLLDQCSKSCNGNLDIVSKKGEGTKIKAIMQLDHIDRPPVGDLASTITSLLTIGENKELIYKHLYNGDLFEFSKSEISEMLDGISLQQPWILKKIRELIQLNLNELRNSKEQSPQENNSKEMTPLQV